MLVSDNSMTQTAVKEPELFACWLLSLHQGQWIALAEKQMLSYQQNVTGFYLPGANSITSYITSFQDSFIPVVDLESHSSQNLKKPKQKQYQHLLIAAFAKYNDTHIIGIHLTQEPKYIFVEQTLPNENNSSTNPIWDKGWITQFTWQKQTVNIVNFSEMISTTEKTFEIDSD